jgi:hypothetical protein
MPKSIIRTKIENAGKKVGLSLHTNPLAFTDKSQSGWRIKYGYLEISEKKMKKFRKALRKEFKNNDFRVWYVKPVYSFGVSGLAIKIFN